MGRFLAKRIVILSFFIFGACVGSDEPAGVETMSALIDGDLFSLSDDFDTAFGRKIPITRVNTVLTIQGTNNLGKGFIFKIAPYGGIGTYDLGPASLTDHLATWINDAEDTTHFTTGFEGTSGQFIVTEDSGGRIGGTFNFTAKSSNNSPTKKINSGLFKINLQ